MTHPQPTYSKGKPKRISLKIKNNTRMSAFNTFIQHFTGSSIHSNERKRTNERHPIGMKEVNCYYSQMT